jgi:hypothetical protein
MAFPTSLPWLRCRRSCRLWCYSRGCGWRGSGVRGGGGSKGRSWSWCRTRWRRYDWNRGWRGSGGWNRCRSWRRTRFGSRSRCGCRRRTRLGSWSRCGCRRRRGARRRACHLVRTNAFESSFVRYCRIIIRTTGRRCCDGGTRSCSQEIGMLAVVPRACSIIDSIAIDIWA